MAPAARCNIWDVTCRATAATVFPLNNSSEQEVKSVHFLSTHFQLWGSKKIIIIIISRYLVRHEWFTAAFNHWLFYLFYYFFCFFIFTLNWRHCFKFIILFHFCLFVYLFGYLRFSHLLKFLFFCYFFLFLFIWHFALCRSCASLLFLKLFILSFILNLLLWNLVSPSETLHF